MKRYLCVLIGVIVLMTALFGQTLSIQGVLRDNTGASVADGQKNFTFSLYTVVSGGTKTWDETQQINVVNGVYSATLGAVNSLAGLNYNVSYWLGISVDGAEEMTPRTKLTLSPYAIAGGVQGTKNVFPQSGNVGIGTLTPESELDVIGSVHLTGDINLENAKKITSSGRLHISGEEYLYLLNKNGVIVSKSWDGNGNLKVEGDLTTNGNMITGGNVGIGTTPRSKLMVHDGAAYVSRSVGYNAIGTYTYLLMGMNQHQSDDSYNTKFLFDIEATSATKQSKMHLRAGKVSWSGDEFAIPDAAGKTEIMTFDGGGNVGIGITNPGHKLDVDGGIRLNGGHLIFNSQNGVINWGSNGYLYFRTNTTTGDINTYTEQARIENDGEIKARGFINVSDARLKTGISSYEKGLSKAMRLRPARFELISSPGVQKIGFIANEVQDVVPEVVEEWMDGYLGLDYGAISAVAIAAIQDQQKIIENQQKEIDDLKERLTRIEASLRKQ